MKYKIIVLFILFSAFVNISFSQQVVDSVEVKSVVDTTNVEEEKPVLSKRLLVDEVVAVVGNKMILLSDYYTQKAEWRRSRGMHARSPLSDSEKLDVFEQLLAQKLLSIGAIADSLEVNELSVVSNVEMRINQIVSKLGSVEQLEAELNAPLYQIREMLQRNMYEEQLANMMKGEMSKDMTVTPLEVSRLAKQMSKDSVMIVPRQMSYAHILKLPPTDYEAKMKVKADLLELRKRIMNGFSFSALARMHSDDGSAANGGELDYSSLDGEYAQNFTAAIKTLKVGGTSGIVETEYGFHIIQLMDIKNNLYKVRHILMRVKMDADQLNTALLQLDSIANEIRGGTITFEEAALKYSDDNKSKNVGGVVLNQEAVMRYGVEGQTDKFYTDDLRYDSREVMALKVGEISNAFFSYDPEKGDKICKIVKLVGDYPEHRANAVDDYSYYEKIARERKSVEIFDEWINKRIIETYIRIEPPYNQSGFRYNWIKK